MTGPDYNVVRLSLVALTKSKGDDTAKLEQICRVLDRSDSREARRWAAYSLQRGLQRMAGDSLEKKYINVVGGHFGCPDLCMVARELSRMGLDGSFDIVPGPLMRATHGKSM